MILLLACATSPWTAEAVVASHRARFDTNGDGRFTAEEYARHAWVAPPFGSADADGDGDLSASELFVLVRTQSPGSFDDEATARTEEWTVEGESTMTPDQRALWELLLAMADEVRLTGGTAPDAAAVAAAVASGSVESPATQAVLTTLRAGWEGEGWTWPAALSVGEVTRP